MPNSRRDVPDEAVVRSALSDQFDACDACRACVSYCATFPLLFDLIHAVTGAPGAPERAAGDLTVAEQDRVGDSCTRCGQCTAACSYGYDVPSVFDDALAMRRSTGQIGWLRRAGEVVRGVARKPA